MMRTLVEEAINEIDTEIDSALYAEAAYYGALCVRQSERDIAMFMDVNF